MLKRVATFALLIAIMPANAADLAPRGTGAKAKDPQRKICEAVEETGSRLSSKRVCLTAEQWKAQRGGTGNKRSAKSSSSDGGR